MTESNKLTSINEITVNNSNTNCLISTITVSEAGEEFTSISKEYFMTKDQQVNNTEREKKDQMG